MSFPTPTLDDRTFQDIVDEAKRLIPKYCPEWTNHNLSDPGIALIELFAWMTEMMLFRINQVPDRFFASFLNLVGVAPFPAAPARADLTFWLSAIDTEPVLVPANTQVGTLQTDTEPSIIFMTDQDLHIVQPVLSGFLSAAADTDRYLDMWDDLHYERSSVTCFLSEPLTKGDAFYIGFEESIAGNTIRLDIEAQIQGLGVDPDSPPMRWEVWSGARWIPATLYEDTTGGINRDGSVTLLVPMANEPLTLGTTRAHWLRGVLMKSGTDEAIKAEPDYQPPYERSPQIRTLRAVSLGGTVSARHSQPASTEVLGISSGEPGQRFQTAYSPVLERRGDEGLRLIDGSREEEWEEVDSFEDSGPDDLHFRWDTNGVIDFGPAVIYPDGSTKQHGAVPRGGSEIVLSDYRYGGGAVGNVGAGTLTVMKSTIPYIDRVDNRRPAEGGTDPETIDNAKLRGPMTLRTGDRAVTVTDFERLTLEASPTVARARCLKPTEERAEIGVRIVPQVDLPPDVVSLDDFAISEDLVDEIREHLDQRRILGTTVKILPFKYKGVSAVTRVALEVGWDRDLVRDRCLQTLYRYVHPLVGGPDGKGWPFSWDLNAGAVFQLLNDVEGVRAVEDVILFDADLRTERRVGRGKERLQLGEDALFASFNHYVLVR